MGHTISVHIEKHKLSAVNGLQKHNARNAKSYGNENIDKTKSKDNLAITPKQFSENQTYQKRLEQILAKRYEGKRAPRKDAIRLIGITIQTDAQLATKSPEKQKQVLNETMKEIRKYYGGSKNVIGTYYHQDEKGAPHIHLDMIPLTEDGRLSAKDLLSKQRLRELQDNTLNFVQSSYPELDFKRASELDRGFSNGKSQQDFERLAKAKEELEKQKRELDEREKKVNKQVKFINDVKEDLTVMHANMAMNLAPQMNYKTQLKLSQRHINHAFEFLDRAIIANAFERSIAATIAKFEKPVEAVKKTFAKRRSQQPTKKNEDKEMEM